MRHGQNLDPIVRIAVFSTGMALAVFLLLYSFKWAEFPIQVTAAGQNVTDVFMGVMVVLVGILGGTLIKSGLLGKWRLD